MSSGSSKIGLGFLFLVISSYQPEKKDFIFRLKDGSIFKTTLDIEKLTVKTEFGKLDVEIKDIKVIKAAKDGFIVKTKKDSKDSTIQGKIEQSFAVKTSHGVLNVKMEDINEIIPSKKMVFNDDSVVGFWNFSGDEDVKLDGAKYINEDSTDAVKIDLSEGNVVEIPHKDEYNSKDAMTVEIRFKLNDLPASTNYIYLIQKSKTWGAGDSTFLIALNTGEKKFFVGAYCSNNSMPHTYPVVPLEKDKWHHFTAVIDAKNKTMGAYFDGAKVDSTLSTGFGDDKLRTNDSPILIPSAGEGKHSCIIWIDYMRMSNTARTEEEVKDMWESGSLGVSSKQSNDKEYNTVIVTKLSEKYTCKLDLGKIDIESSLGNVQVDKSRIGKISFFEYRKEQIEKLHKEAKERISKLGNEDPTERDKAEDELKKMGWVIMPVLEQFKEDKDEEVKLRIKKLIEASGKKYEISKDMLEGKGLLLRGWIANKTIRAKTRYGNIEIKAEDIKGITLNNTTETLKGLLAFKLKDNSVISGKLALDKISLTTDFGKLEVATSEIVSVVISKEEDSIVTKKSTLQGVITETVFELESQIGKIKINKDQIIEISQSLN